MDDSRNIGSAAGKDQADGSIGKISIADVVDRGSHLYSTRTSEAFDSVDRKTGARVLLWTLRFPLTPDSETAQDYVGRLATIADLELGLPKFLRYGVDVRGIAFLATEYVRGRSVLEQSGGARALERTFTEMLQAVASLHKLGILLGDITLDSFLLDERGRVVLAALLGPFESGARQTAMLPPPETLQFLAPEQRSVSGLSAAADVYAFGVYGYRLFTGRFLHGDKGVTPEAEDITAMTAAPSSVRSDLPFWVDGVLGRCLEPNVEDRYQDAGEVLQAIFDSTQSGLPPAGGGRWARRTMIVSPQQRDQAIRPRALQNPTQANIKRPENRKEEIQASVTQAVNVFTWGVAILVGVLGAGLMFFFFERWNSSAGEDECAILTHADYAPSELKPLIFDVTAKGVAIEKREEAIARIADSKDPIAYAVLLALTKCDAEPKLKQTAQEMIVRRVREQGMERAARVLDKWFQRMSASKKNAAEQPVYSLLLRACDFSRPLESRQQALRESFPLDPEVSTQMAAALSLDEREDHFLPLLRNFLAEQNPGLSFEGRGAGALILSRGSLSEFFENELGDMIPKFADDDLKWILEQSTRAENPVAVDVSKEMLRRKALSPFQSIFLKALVDNTRGKSLDVLGRSLLKGAVGKLDRDDIMQIGRWLNQDAEQVLLAICATTPNQDWAVEAFDILAGRSTNSEPASSLLKWVKSQFWEYRKKIVKAVGILGLVEQASDVDLNFAMGELMPFAPSGSLFRVLVDSGDDRLVRMALERLGEITSSESLLELLGHKNKGVRMEAVRALKSRNELSVLQGILQAYGREKDEEVRALYREVHWVTRDRDANRPPQP